MNFKKMTGIYIHGILSYNGVCMITVSKSSRIILYGLMFLALMAGSLVPAGFMPAPGRNGKVEIVVCSGAGFSTIMVDAHQVPPPLRSLSAKTGQNDRHGSQESGQESDLDSGHSCPYAPVLAQGMPDMQEAALPELIRGSVQSPGPATAVLSRIALKPWFSQGPPVS